MVEALLPLLDWIDRNQTEWMHLMADQETTAQFAYDML